MKTAKEFRDNYAERLSYINWADLCEDYDDKGLSLHENLVMEQYAREYARSIQYTDEWVIATAELKHHTGADHVFLEGIDAYIQGMRDYRTQILNKL